MSTRGFVGYKLNGKIKGWYNHFDSYPDGLGTTLLEQVYCKYSWDEIKAFFKRLKLVKQQGSGGDPIYEAHKSVYDEDWRTASVTLEDGSEFIRDGLFCEYSYVFDLDSLVKKLLLFKGFGKGPSKGYEDYFFQSEAHRISSHSLSQKQYTPLVHGFTLSSTSLYALQYRLFRWVLFKSVWTPHTHCYLSASVPCISLRGFCLINIVIPTFCDALHFREFFKECNQWYRVSNVQLNGQNITCYAG